MNSKLPMEQPPTSVRNVGSASNLQMEASPWGSARQDSDANFSFRFSKVGEDAWRLPLSTAGAVAQEGRPELVCEAWPRSAIRPLPELRRAAGARHRHSP